MTDFSYLQKYCQIGWKATSSIYQLLNYVLIINEVTRFKWNKIATRVYTFFSFLSHLLRNCLISGYTPFSFHQFCKDRVITLNICTFGWHMKNPAKRLFFLRLLNSFLSWLTLSSLLILGIIIFDSTYSSNPF